MTAPMPPITAVALLVLLAVDAFPCDHVSRFASAADLSEEDVLPALLRLTELGFVSASEGSPSKCTYQPTAEGLDLLRRFDGLAEQLGKLRQAEWA